MPITQDDFDELDRDQQLTDEDRAAISRFPSPREIFAAVFGTAVGSVVVAFICVRLLADLTSLGALVALVIVLIGGEIGMSAGACLGLCVGALAVHWITSMVIVGFRGE